MSNEELWEIIRHLREELKKKENEISHLKNDIEWLEDKLMKFVDES